PRACPAWPERVARPRTAPPGGPLIPAGRRSTPSAVDPLHPHPHHERYIELVRDRGPDLPGRDVAEAHGRGQLEGAERLTLGVQDEPFAPIDVGAVLPPQPE